MTSLFSISSQMSQIQLVISLHSDSPKPRVVAAGVQILIPLVTNVKDKEKRAAFDKNLGVINKIKSLAITITENNFNRLILEGNDLWII